MEASWALTPSFDRAAPSDLSDLNSAYERWENFFLSLHSRLGRPMADSKDEIAALAQHYGTPTRLLDFSLSPYIAAFFAYFDALRFHRPETHDIAIWALHVPTFRSESNGQFEIISARNVYNQRIRNQLGKFLMNKSKFTSLNEYIEKENPQLGSAVSLFLIPVSQAVTALNDLLLMGISPVELYPDHEGVAMYVRLRQLLEGYRF